MKDLLSSARFGYLSHAWLVSGLNCVRVLTVWLPVLIRELLRYVCGELVLVRLARAGNYSYRMSGAEKAEYIVYTIWNLVR